MPNSRLTSKLIYYIQTEVFGEKAQTNIFAQLGYETVKFIVETYISIITLIHTVQYF